MDKTKSKLAAFFNDDDDEPAFPQKKLDTSKISQFTTGTARKSRREKEQEVADAKKKAEEENAAKAYADFLNAFEGEDAGRNSSTTGFVKAGGSQTIYHPLSQKSSDSRAPKPFTRESTHPSPPPAAPKPKGKRAMDAFLEEIKRDQAEREAKYSRNALGRSVTALAAYEGQSGSKDRGDPETSNVFVANLPSHVTEQSLGQFFARVGPVGSVKIMWPRGDGTAGPGADMTASRRTKNSGLSGFVSFMKRNDAEEALREFDGLDWGGSVLRVGWSKAVPKAAKPMYVAAVSRSRHKDRRGSGSRSRSRSPSGYGRRSRSRDQRSYSRSPSWDRSKSPRQRTYGRSRHSRSRSPAPRRRSTSPYNRKTPEDEAVTDTFIRAVAAEVKGHGSKYEASLREREQNNPKYAFMMNKHHRRHAFYKGLVESERALDPEFDDAGYNSVYSTDSAEDSERERCRKNSLGKLARKRFEAMLRAMSGKRGELARCMAFSLEHAEAAPEVSEIILASLLVDTTPVPRKVARLHLICDILHNSAASVPSAWKFRQEFQSRLGIVFDHLANIYHSFPGRITAETFKKQITAVVDVWEDWIVFPPEFTTELRMRLEGATMDAAQQEDEAPAVEAQPAISYSSKFKSSSFQPATTAPTPDEDSDGGEPMDQGSDVEGGKMDDIDGEPVADDVDGVPLNDDVDGVPFNDGVPMDDDLDGAPLDDLDGMPMQEGK